MTTCRSLQSLIATPALSSFAVVPPPALGQLPTPPLAHAPLPMKLRLRARPGRSDSSKAGEDDLFTRRRRIAKRSAPARGVNKRRRGSEDDMGRDDLSSDEDDIDSDLELSDSESQAASRTIPSPVDSEEPEPAAPSTPKRARISPEQLPLGLERSDFHDVYSLEGGCPAEVKRTDVEVGTDGSDWSAEDDRILVELVLEKLKLSKSEWQDCARNLGKDRHSVNRRWKSLIMKGEVGLKTRSSSRRAKLHSTWR